MKSRFGMALAFLLGVIPLGFSAESSLKDILTKLREKHDLPALGAAIVTSQGVKSIAVVGVRKRGEEVAATVQDPFHLASDTKAFTSALIGLLVEEGKLSWDSTMAQVFPEIAKKMRPEVQKITLKHLLTHHAGLEANPKGTWWKFATKRPVAEQRLAVVEWLAEQKLKHKPGSKYHYSNLGYVLAGAMAEKVAGASWEDLIQKKVLMPLGIKSAGFGPMKSTKKVEKPWPHNSEGKPVTPTLMADNPPVMGPAGRLHCSLGDWGTFIADQLKGASGKAGLLKPATYKALQRTTGEKHHYAMGGWIRLEGRAGVILSHDGDNTLSHSSAWLLPKKDVAVLIVSNQGGKAAEKACQEAAMLLLSSHFKKTKP